MSSAAVMRLKVVIIFLAVIVSFAYSSECPSTCSDCVPDDLIQPRFNVKRFLGRWYEQRWIPLPPVNPANLFVQKVKTYSLIGYGRSTQILEIIRARILSTGKPIELRKVWNATERSGEYTDRFVPRNGPPFILTQRIIATDYRHFSLTYGCLNPWRIFRGNCTQPYLVVLTRRLNPSVRIQRRIKRILKENCLSKFKFFDSKQMPKRQ